MATTVLLILSWGCLLLATFALSPLGNVQMLPLGLLFMVTAMLVGAPWPSLRRPQPR